MHSAIITTAARTHWRHDFTGRALPRPANEPQAALDTPRAVNCAPGPEQRAGGAFVSAPFHIRES